MDDKPTDNESAGARHASAISLAAALVGVVLCLVTVTSCSLKMPPVEPTAEPKANTPTPVTVSAPGGNWHDLAIISLDFDPPLKSGEVLAVDRAPVMLVAVDNKGNQSETSVMVRLRITAEDESDVVIADKRTIPLIAQGEAKVVKFDRFSTLPPRELYIVRVEVDPSPGEVSLVDNTREIRVQVVPSSDR